MTENSALAMQREALTAIKKAASKAKEEEDEYISKEEIMNDLRESLTEMYIAQRDGTKRKTLQELIDEL